MWKPAGWLYGCRDAGSETFALHQLSRARREKCYPRCCARYTQSNAEALSEANPF
jgi:hypothetical protein